MNNDISDLMDSIFYSGKLGGAPIKRDKAAPSVSAPNDELSSLAELVQRQSAQLAAMDKNVQADIAEMTRQLEQDGLLNQEERAAAGLPAASAAKAFETAKPAEAPADPLAAFSGLASQLSGSVIGQEDFLQQLTVAMKRPYISGGDAPVKNVILICGKKGTGRHSALRLITEKLAEKGLLTGEPAVIDLALYADQASAKLFLQDLFATLGNGAPVVVFDHYDACHPSILPRLAELCAKGQVRLDKRYVAQKGILVETGTALTPKAVGSIDAKGQYLVFISEGGSEKVAGAFGSGFLTHVGDVCETAALGAEALSEIAKRLWDELAEKAQASLKLTPEPTSRVVSLIVSKFVPEEGVPSMRRFTQQCYKAFSEYRLQNEDYRPITVKVAVSGDGLTADFGAGAVALAGLLPAGYDADLTAVQAELDKLVGLDKVKDYVRSLEQNCRVQAMRKAKGMKTSSPAMHMIFTGNPGTGKTTIARLVSQYLKAAGALSGGQLVEVTRADLVGKYVGHTAPMTNQVLHSALGGVLFIDEAYSLYRGKDDSFGLEAIDTLVKGMEDNRDDLVVILAGYTAEMEEFLTANSGLRSRFPNIIEFPDYTGEELLEIAKLTCAGKGYRLDEGCLAPLEHWFEMVQQSRAREAGNGRLVRNKIEEAILAQSRRVMTEQEPQLDLLLAEDFTLEPGL